jgi:hypothetical protein
MTTIAELQQRIDEAELALHKLMTGAREVTISVGGFGTTTYAETDSVKLEKYIAMLKQTIARKKGLARRGPLWVYF